MALLAIALAMAALVPVAGAATAGAASGAAAVESPQDPLWPGASLEAQGVEVYYRVLGEGPDVVLLHGTARSGYTWRFNAAPLARAGFRVWVVDLPGFGQSAKPPGEYTAAELARALADFLDAAGITYPVLIGHELGAEVALWLAYQEPARLQQLVLVDATGTAPLAGSFRFLARPVVGDAAIGMMPSWYLGRILREAYLDPTLVTSEMVDLYYGALASPGGKGVLRSRLRNYEQTLQALPSFLPYIPHPTLVVWGEQDPYLPVGVGRHMAMRMPDARLAVVGSAGHLPHEEQPEAFNRLVVEFLKPASRRDQVRQALPQ